MLHLDLKPVDRRFYAEHLAGWLPTQIVDIHTHVWRPASARPASELPAALPTRGAKWPERVAVENPIEDLLATYRVLLPERQVTPLIFGSPMRTIDQEQGNAYVRSVAGRHALPALLVSMPEWPAAELERQVRDGGFWGLKPYLNFAPPHIPEPEITIFDFMPHAHLEVADAHGWIVMLHLPRKARLRDPLNLQHLLDIERRYPHVKLIVAHIGRAYCQADVGDALTALQDTEHMLFDFSANTNAWVMEQAIRAVGPKRILFGSDLPILRMRMRRICKDGIYINLVPPDLYGDVSDDPHMRAVGPEEADNLTFFLYEELLAWRRAAETVGLTRADLEDVFYHNAQRLLPGYCSAYPCEGSQSGCQRTTFDDEGQFHQKIHAKPSQG